MIETRVALPDDHLIIRSIRERSFASVRSVYQPLASVAPISSETRGQYVDIIASVAGSHIGTVGTAIDGTILCVSGLAVLPQYRKRGVAFSLLNHANRLASEAGCKSMRLFTIRETGNVAIFARLGFSVASESVAEWCVSDRFDTLHETEMVRTVV